MKRANIIAVLLLLAGCSAVTGPDNKPEISVEWSTKPFLSDRQQTSMSATLVGSGDWVMDGWWLAWDGTDTLAYHEVHAVTEMTGHLIWLTASNAEFQYHFRAYLPLYPAVQPVINEGTYKP